MTAVLRVRAERATDRAAVHAVESAAFGSPDEADLVDALRADTDPHVSLVALVDGTIVGHVFFSPATLEAHPDAPRVGALGPVAVAPDRQGRGIGSALMRAGLEESARLGWRAVFLVGDPRYYERFGFVPAVPLGLHYESSLLDPAFQVRILDNGALEGRSGRVRFHPAFARAEAS